MNARVYPEKSLRWLLADPFWHQGRMHHRNDETFSTKEKQSGRQSQENKPRKRKEAEADR